MILASCVVLLPGAAQASITWLPSFGAKINAGRQEAYNHKTMTKVLTTTHINIIAKCAYLNKNLPSNHSYNMYLPYLEL